MEINSRNSPSVLFVCTANICRSPMAEALFRARMIRERADWREWRVASAGTWAVEGETAAKNSQQVMAQRGLDLSGHRAKTVTAEMLKEFNLILTMEAGQKEAMQIEFPSVANRIFMLSEMIGMTEPVKDPYGGPLEGYITAAQKIDNILARGMPRIYDLVFEKRVKQ